MTAYLYGLLLGLTMILPIGVQNLFVLSQGLAVGYPRVFIAVIGAGCCDTLLIALGAVGVSTLLLSAPWLREMLVIVGVAFMLVIGVGTLRSTPKQIEVRQLISPIAVVTQTVAVSLLNPHAILDTVGVIGGAIAAQPTYSRLSFALGAISASWLWFTILGTSGSLMQSRMTWQVRLWFQRISGLLMIAFAVILASELGAVGS